MTSDVESDLPLHAATIEDSIEALDKARAEFLHHAARLEQTERPNPHLVTIARKYREAARVARMLARFQRGRLARRAVAPVDAARVDSVSDAERAAAGLTEHGHAEAVI